MAIRKSAPKSAAKKATRPEKKAAAKGKPAKSAAATKPKPGKAKDAKARSGKKPEASAPKATPKATPKEAPKSAKAAAASPESEKSKSRSRAKAQKPAAQAAPTPSQAKGARGKGAAKSPAPAPAAAPPRKRSASAGPPRTVAVTVGSAIVSKLGRKWNCFQCGASFYDLNRPDPLCPKCGADQRQRPKVSASAPAHPPAPRKQPRPMAPLLDDEDDGTVRYDEEFDLGVRTDIDDAEQDLFPPGDAEEEDVFGGEEE